MAKRLIVGLLATLVGAQAADLTVQSVQLSSGQSIEIEVRFRPEVSSVTGIQFDLAFDGVNLRLDALPGLATTSAGKTLVSVEPSSGKKRYIVAGMNREPILEGVVVRLTLNVANNAPSGEYTLNISNAAGTDKDAHTVAVAAQSGVVKVAGGPPR